MFHQAAYDEPLIRDMRSGTTYRVPGEHTETPEIPDSLVRKEINIPNVSEYDVVRHFTRLSEMNYSVDTGIYPLGSCTMKFNPKYADVMASWSEFRDVHPLRPQETVQGNLRIMYELQEYLKAISDMDAVSLQPLAGADGEFTGISIIRKYFMDQGTDSERREVIVPDSAHGTNPASAAMAGYDVVEIPSTPSGTVDLDALKSVTGRNTAAFMITNPNTLGIFDGGIAEIARIIHEAGALLYYDGANFNAILGITSPGLMGFDVVHFNLHKTFATPHGGGGPGAAPVGVKKFLEKYLPTPIVEKNGDFYSFKDVGDKSIGKIGPYYGSFMVLLRAWAYIRYHGRDGLEAISRRAVLNTNYLERRISGSFRPSNNSIKKHEVVVSASGTGKTANDVAKYLLDMGMHPPTIYFPLIVKEAMMIEVTETVSKKDLDAYADAMLASLKEDAKTSASRPVNTKVTRIDEVRAARDLELTWNDIHS